MKNTPAWQGNSGKRKTPLGGLHSLIGLGLSLCFCFLFLFGLLLRDLLGSFLEDINNRAATIFPAYTANAMHQVLRAAILTNSESRAFESVV